MHHLFVDDDSLRITKSSVYFFFGIVGYPTFSGKGLNYNTRRMYDISDETLSRDFSRFRNDGINVISLSLYWYRIEGNTRGSYNGTYADGTPYGAIFLDHVKRFIRAANQYGIRVLVTFHTLWQQTGDEWCTPDYVIDPQTGNNTHVAILKSEEMKQAFLQMVNCTVSYLKSENIWAWALLNEPWGVEYVESFIDLIQRESLLVKSITNLPVTVRFVSAHTWTEPDMTHRMINHFITMWKWDQRIFEALDFISFNCYIQFPELYDTWLNITNENVNGVSARGKRVWITEFGFDSDDDLLQSEYYQKHLQAFEQLPINGWMAWMWNQLDLQDLGKGYNLIRDAEGNPRQAYYELLKHDPSLS